MRFSQFQIMSLDFLIMCLFCVAAAAQNSSSVLYHAQPSNESILLGEGAIGGMIPTSIIIVLVAFLRILQMFRRQQQQQQSAVNSIAFNRHTAEPTVAEHQQKEVEEGKQEQQ